MVNQIKKNSKDIRSFLNDIEGINLFCQPMSSSDNSLAQCKVSKLKIKKYISCYYLFLI